MSSDYYDRIGWTPPTPTEILTRATACLRRHDASDLAGMLGLDEPADVEVRPEPPAPANPCRRGHDLNVEGYRDSAGSRRCRGCQREDSRKHYHRRKAQAAAA